MSCEALDDVFGLLLAQNRPVTPSTSGEDARYSEVAAPRSGLFMNERMAGSISRIQPLESLLQSSQRHQKIPSISTFPGT